MEEGLLDEIDIRFLLLITRGYNNSYAIYRQLKKEAEEKHILTMTDKKEAQEKSIRSMTYKNANRRISLLVQVGVIEEVKYTERVPHGRIDYKLTLKGLQYLIPYFLNNPEEVIELVSYLDKIGIDRFRLSDALMENRTKVAKALNEFQRYTGELYGHPERQPDIKTDGTIESLKEKIRVFEQYKNTVIKLQHEVEVENKELLDLIKFSDNNLSHLRKEMSKLLAGKENKKKKPS